MEAIFKFNLGDTVQLALSDEVGQVIGRAEYSESGQQYYVRYLAGDGRQVDAWWTAQALQHAIED